MILTTNRTDEDFGFTLKNDYAFKGLLRVEKNKTILQDFLPEEEALYESRMKLKTDIVTVYESRFKQEKEIKEL